MIYSISGAEALSRRTVHPSPGTGIEHWGTVFFGPRVSTSEQAGPQATMSDLNPNETILPHFHGTTQFQLFPAGSGTIGKSGVLQPLMVQYKDHHTAYGPIIAGPCGLSFMALRIRTGVSAPVYLDRPGYREQLKPSKRRNWLSAPQNLSTIPVLENRKEVLWEPLFDSAKIDDGMAAHMLRMGANMAVSGPDPKAAGGYYVVVVNGAMVLKCHFGRWWRLSRPKMVTRFAPANRVWKRLFCSFLAKMRNTRAGCFCLVQLTMRMTMIRRSQFGDRHDS
jgi:hypothetical protein